MRVASVDLQACLQSLFQALAAPPRKASSICDARAGDWPVVFVNAAMEQLTGYDAGSLRGRNLRFLQAEDHDQEGLAKIRAALRDGDALPDHAAQLSTRRHDVLERGHARARCATPTGASRTSRASIARAATGCGSTARDARDPSMNTQTMLAYLRDDKLTGLLRRTYFEELVKRDWGLAQRESRRLSFLVFDLDCYSQYRDVFGRPARISPSAASPASSAAASVAPATCAAASMRIRSPR